MAAADQRINQQGEQGQQRKPAGHQHRHQQPRPAGRTLGPGGQSPLSRSGCQQSSEAIYCQPAWVISCTARRLWRPSCSIETGEGLKVPKAFRVGLLPQPFSGYSLLAEA